MSRRGNCHDNASMESFWSTLKLELIYRGRLTSHRHARSEIFDFIEVFDNCQRRHTSLGGLFPLSSNSKTTKQPTKTSLFSFRLSKHAYCKTFASAAPALQWRKGC